MMLSFCHRAWQIVANKNCILKNSVACFSIGHTKYEKKHVEMSYVDQRQSEGIAAAKAKGIKFGRKPSPLPPNFHEVYQRWKMGKITVKQAAFECGMPQATFYTNLTKDINGIWYIEGRK